MLCESCSQNEATMHLTQVIDGVVKKLHLCEACASNSGFDVQNPVSITDMLLGMGQSPVVPQVGSREKQCKGCGMRRSDFRKSSRMGCADCYESFAAELPPLLRAIHHSEQHRGKVPACETVAVRATAELAELQDQLEKAVAAERFEDAAKIRDAIRKCRQLLEPRPAGAGRKKGTRPPPSPSGPEAVS